MISKVYKENKNSSLKCIYKCTPDTPIQRLQKICSFTIKKKFQEKGFSENYQGKEETGKDDFFFRQVNTSTKP